MLKDTLRELKNEFIEAEFTREELNELAFAGFVALKDYKAYSLVEEAE